MQLTELYQKYFQRYEAGPLLIVDTSRIDLVNGENCYQALLEEVLHVGSGRHFLHLDTFL